jgi:SP family general alpha glucoside:H+ symporter-like MFS transporter
MTKLIEPLGLFFGPLAALSCILLYFVFPETKNRSYPELDELFERRISARKFSSTETSVQREAMERNGQPARQTV